MMSRIFVSCQLCCKSFLLLEPLHPFCLDHCDNPLVGKQANRSVANIVFGSLNKSSNTTCNVLLLMTYFTPTFKQYWRLPRGDFLKRWTWSPSLPRVIFWSGVLQFYSLNIDCCIFSQKTQLWSFFYLFQHISGKSGLSVLLAFMVSTMTFSKTVLYFLVSTSLCNGEHFVNHSDWRKTVLLYIIPNGFWIVIPFFCMVATGSILVRSMESGQLPKEKKKSQ